MASPLLAAVIVLLTCIYSVSGIVVVEVKYVKPMFDYLRYVKGLVHTRDEEADHFNRFEKELSMRTEPISHDRMVDLFDDTRPVIMQSLVDEINSKQNTWTASVDQGDLGGLSLGDAKRLCGSFMEPTKPLDKEDHPARDLQALPENFDARVAFSQCKNVIGHIWDQSRCGDCWAFGPVQAFNDRVCIALNGADQTLLSPGYMSACCNKDHNCSMSHGCAGGYPREAWKFLYTNGVVRGGDYVPEAEMKEADGCWPYDFPKCAHHTNDSTLPNCGNVRIHPRGKNETNFFQVSAFYYVYEDFFAYKSGVYKHTYGTHYSGHVVKIIGWGKENGEDYWLVVNSWNEEWGDHGLFKIGINECNITDNVLSGYPNLPRE